MDVGLQFSHNLFCPFGILQNICVRECAAKENRRYLKIKVFLLLKKGRDSQNSQIKGDISPKEGRRIFKEYLGTVYRIKICSNHVYHSCYSVSRMLVQPVSPVLYLFEVNKGIQLTLYHLLAALSSVLLHLLLTRVSRLLLLLLKFFLVYHTHFSY